MYSAFNAVFGCYSELQWLKKLGGSWPFAHGASTNEAA